MADIGTYVSGGNLTAAGISAGLTQAHLTGGQINAAGMTALGISDPAVVPTALVLQGTADPSASSGVKAPLGSLYLRTSVGTIWGKTTIPDTGWVQIAPAP